MNIFKRLFTWWNDATLGTWLSLKRGAVKVGEDEYGNTYWESKAIGHEGLRKRYVTYSGYADPSRVPAEWHGWLHHTYDEMPNELAMKRHGWQKPHLPNMTGTLEAYKPSGALDRGGVREANANDYEAWTPE